MVSLSGRTTPLGHSGKRESISGFQSPQSTNGAVANTTKVKVGQSEGLLFWLVRVLSLVGGRLSPPFPRSTGLATTGIP